MGAIIYIVDNSSDEVGYLYRFTLPAMEGGRCRAPGGAKPNEEFKILINGCKKSGSQDTGSAMGDNCRWHVYNGNIR